MSTSMTGKTVLVTGASSGFGLACAEAFAARGARLIVAARRIGRLRQLARGLIREHGAEVRTMPLDVRDRRAVSAAIAGLPRGWRDIDILVNNAGLSRGLNPLQAGEVRDWEEMIDTNVKGLLYVTRAVLPGMAARGGGHVVNVGSIAGHETYPSGNVYCATKAAVRALTKAMRMDLSGTGVRVTSVDPGLAETEFSVVRFRGDRERAKKVYQGLRPLAAADVAEAVVWACERPAHVDIETIVIMPTAQASATIVSRR
jgi:serine 3-dehydrogenase